jgi:hypothetical protein
MAAAPLLSSACSLPGSNRYGERPKEGLLQRGSQCWGAASAAVEELWAFARADPRKPVFAAKVALALALISLLVFIREPRDIVSHSIWAILTVVVVFEFSIGARPSKFQHSPCSLSLSLSGLNVARFSMVLLLSSSWLLDLGAQAPFCCMP